MKRLAGACGALVLSGLAACAPVPAPVATALGRETWTGMSSACIDHAAGFTGVPRAAITATMMRRGPGYLGLYAMDVAGSAYRCEVSGTLAVRAFDPV